MSKVTVLVPSYNHAPFIERTLRSIFAQTLAPEKLIVIDDGSKDESVAVIERVLRDCPFDVQFEARANRGLCATLNEAITLSKTPYFAYISSDDLWLPRFLESRCRTLDGRPGAVLSYGYSFLVDEDDNVTDSTRNWAQYADGNALQMLLYPIIPASASVLYRRETVAQIGWNEDAVLEDYELYLRLASRGDFALDQSELLSAWRVHSYNTSSDFALMMNEWLAAQRRTSSETGLSDGELDRIAERIRFRCVADFIRRGNRAEAWKMFREDRRGSESAIATAKTLMRFLLPPFVYSWRRRSIAKKTGQTIGSLANGT